MNRARTQVQPVRPKHLRPGDSGVFRSVHAAQPAAANDAAQPLHMAPERRVSSRRQTIQRMLAALLRDSLDADGISRRDAGSACDRQHQHVSDMCDPDGRGMSGADVVLLGARSDAFWTGVCELRGLLRGK